MALGAERYRANGIVTKTMRAMTMIVKGRPKESVSRPYTIGETAPEPSVIA